MPSLHLYRRFATAAALALAAFGAASTAQARTDVAVSIGIHVPGVPVHQAPVYHPAPRVYGHPVHVVQPQPVYVQPQPVYVQPRPVYVQPRPVYFQPAPVYVQPGPVIMYPHGYKHHKRHGPRWQHAEWERDYKHGYREHGRHRGHGRDHDDDRD